MKFYFPINSQEDGELAALERRQESILTELKALESEVTTLAVKLKSNEKDSATQKVPQSTSKSTKTANQPSHKRSTTGKQTASKSVPAVDLVSYVRVRLHAGKEVG